MEEHRPNPDDLLKRIYADEATPEKTGKLKIFFGYAAGVGKTYTMLKAAHDAQRAGQDVWVGYVEPHSRPDTVALMDGLAAIPPMEVAYKGITLRELDLDAVLVKKPGLVLVDELAHTNAEGCRHRKRYQDVEELLKAGIDVYTTVNVQHIESLNDIVSSITGVKVHERIPDSVFDSADQVELVDIEPDDLIERLNEGKIYRPQQAQKALHNFFIRENLVSLREISLRRTADRVNRIADKERQRRAEAPGYYTDEHILICLSSSPSNAKVIRTAARLAAAFHGSFTALFVETPHSDELSARNIAKLRENLKLAEQLGAHIATVYGENVAGQIAEYAKFSGVSKIVMGRSNARRGLFSKASLPEQLSALATNIDIYIIPDNRPPYTPEKTPVVKWRTLRRPTGKDMLKSLAILVLVLLVAQGFQYIGVNEENIFTVFILGAIVTALATDGFLCSIGTSAASIILFSYFFASPRFDFIAYNPGYPLGFAIMVAASLITSTLTTRIKEQARQAVLKTTRTESLLETSQRLQQAQGEQAVYDVAGNQLLQLLDCPIIIYPGGTNGDSHQLRPPLVYQREGADVADALAPDEQAVALWAYKNNKHAGATTNTLPGARCLYLAVRSGNKVFGVVGIVLQGGHGIDVFQKSILLAMLNELALAIGQEQLYAAQRENLLQMQQEKLHTDLLRKVSNDLRNPLANIAANADALLQAPAGMDEKQRQALCKDIYNDSVWLGNLMENITSVTRMQNGSMKLEIKQAPLADAVRQAVLQVARYNITHTVDTIAGEDALVVPMDVRQIVQVITDLVGNAIRYTPTGSHIWVTAGKKDEQYAEVTVADDGPGIDAGEKQHLFDIFYTGDSKAYDGRRGMGLGLPLCQSIVAAHGGTIQVRDNHPHGTVVSFTLPWQPQGGGH